MSYNNLLYLLVVIFVVTSGPDSSGYAAGVLSCISLWLGKLGCFYFVCRVLFSPSRVCNPASYLKADRAGSVLAIGMVGIDVYYFHGLYYLKLIPGFQAMPILAHIIGVAIFFFYLSIVWFTASGSHNLAFGRRGDPKVFIGENLRANIPIGLPWVVVSLCVDFLKIIPVVWLHDFMVNGAGELAVFGIFFAFLAFGYPPLLMKIWRCTPVAEGAVRDELVGMCERLQLKYRDVLMWPLFGGQVLTAGVVGFVARFRYILITNGLLTSLTLGEIEAVIAHETGHVKYRHMPLYLFVLLGFSMIIAPVLYGINYLVLQTEWAYQLMEYFQISVAKFLEISETVVLLVTMVFFLRFVFGYFMRNFERQADLHAFTTTGGSGAIGSALERVAYLSGDIRDLPSWHHFGVGQRVDFLLECEKDVTLVQKHHRKVFRMLLIYGLLIIGSIAMYTAIPDDSMDKVLAARAERVLLEDTVKNPSNPEIYWMLGEFYYRHKKYAQAIRAYKDSLLRYEPNANVHNNLAWLLTTCEDESFRNFAVGLRHAERAVELHPSAINLDTFAHALWATGRPKDAIIVEKRALKQTNNADYKLLFQQQIEEWQTQVESLI